MSIRIGVGNENKRKNGESFRSRLGLFRLWIPNQNKDQHENACRKQTRGV